MKIDIKNLNIRELEEFLLEIGEQKYRAAQIYRWLYRGVYDFAEMTDLSARLREKLEEKAFITKLSLDKLQHSKKDGTKKYLFGLGDGNAIESVFLRYHHGNSVCISSQAGCLMGCAFCASTIGGLQRDLTAAEMADQIIAIEKETGERVGNVIVMGTGEPFDNYENLCRFIDLIHEPLGLGLGLRSITVSTCGILPKLASFGRDYPKVNVAISLHGPNDEIRGLLMPINKKYPMSELLKACKAHTEATGRRITFEYALINGVNDREEHASELAKKLTGMLCHVNLIPLNKVDGTDFSSADKRSAEVFQRVLEGRGITVTLRREMGDDIDAACGQLRLREAE